MDGIIPQGEFVDLYYQSLSTASNMDHQLLSQKVRQKISVMKTNSHISPGVGQK